MIKKLLYYSVSMLACAAVSCSAEQVEIVHKNYVLQATQPKLIGEGPYSEKLLKLNPNRGYAVKTHKGEFNVRPDQKSNAAPSPKTVSYAEKTLSQVTKNSSHILEGSLHFSPYVIPYGALKNFSIDTDNYGVVFGNIPNVPIHVVVGKFIIPFGSGSSESIEANPLEKFGWAANRRAAAVNFASALYQDFTARISIFTLFNDPEKNVLGKSNEKRQQNLSISEDHHPWGMNLKLDLEKFSTKATVGLSYITDNPAENPAALSMTDHLIKESLSGYVQATWGPIKLHLEGITGFETGLFRPYETWFSERMQGTNIECALDLLKLSNLFKVNALPFPFTFALGCSFSNIGTDAYDMFVACKFKKIDAYTGGFIDAATISYKWIINKDSDSSEVENYNMTLQLVHDWMKS